MADVKNLLDSIINSTDNSYSNDKGPVLKNDTVGATITHNNFHPQTADAGKFREKLSLYVLHDLVDAMMHDDTKDLNQMIDNSIMNHINNEYNGSCYGYLCDARDRCRAGKLKSPVLSAIIQEVDDKTVEAMNKLKETKDEDIINGRIDIKSILKEVTNYEDFRNKLKEEVSKKVVDDVVGVITKRNDAPVFDNVDEELDKKTADDVAEEEENTQESVIMKICGSIVSESYVEKNPMSTEEGLNQAIVEYCLHQLDMLTKSTPKRSIWQRHNI